MHRGICVARPFDVSSEEGGLMRVEPYARVVSMPVHAENIFHFPAGLPAFEHVKEFVFIHKPDTSPFLFMHALEPADLAFVCVDPFLIRPDYRPEIGQADVDALHLSSSKELLLLSIVTVARDVRGTTANLQAPLAINITACLGRQVICENHYPIRCRIWDALEKHSHEELCRDTTPVAVPSPG